MESEAPGPRPEDVLRELRRSEAAGADPETLAQLWSRAASAHRRRFWSSGERADLDLAVDGYRTALATGTTDRAARANDLAVVLTDRFDVTGESDDLAEAMRTVRTAMAAVAEDSAQWAECAATLALCLWDRYDATGSLTDLDQAIALGGRALAVLPRAALGWARICSNLAMLHMDRYERLVEDRDLRESVRLAQAAVEAAHADDPELGGWFNNLGNALLTRFGTQFGDRESPPPDGHVDPHDLDAAIAAYRKALEVSPWGVAGRATFLSNLGNALVDRADTYRLAGQPERSEPVLRAAVDTLAEAVSVTEDTAPYLASRLNVLGAAQKAVADLTGSADDVAAARRTLRRACTAGLLIAPEMTVHAADNWMRWAAQRSAWEDVGEADGYLLQAEDALRRAQSLRRHHEAWLAALRGLAQEAAYALVRRGRAEDAAARLERGRAVLLSEALDLVPAAVDRLPEDLRHRYTRAVRRVESARQGLG
ncbi:hypothetical protein ACFVGY_19970 [Streptomyces sp. NPDC127106]|uniref:hypothetical protein n=1 Tax=Streptomyces sp. NPDC127106 TaxID=3345360 RepID=UPI0036378942